MQYGRANIHSQVTDPQMFYDTSFATTPVLHTKDWKIDDIYVYVCLVFASLVWIEYPQIFERFFGCGWPNPIFHMGMVCHRIGAILCFFLIGKPTGSDAIYVFIQLVF